MKTTNPDGISIIITGDFCPRDRIERLCLDQDYDKIYNDAVTILKSKDLSITNLECPLTEKITPIKKSGPHLRANPKCVEALKFGGFDAVTLANNHILDQDEDGLIDTLRNLKQAGIKAVGAGSNIAEASRPLYLQVKTKMVAILNFAEHEFSIAGKNRSGANPLDPVENYYQILNAKKKASIVIVIIHGGNEGFSLPSPRMVKTYRFFAELGVTCVVGHHTHCPSGFEIHKGVPIFYSLGNFIFDLQNKNRDKKWYEGFFINLNINDDSVKKFELFPYFQCNNSIGLVLMKGREKDNFLSELQQYSNVIGNSNMLETSWNQFCDNKRNYYLSILLNAGRVTRLLLKAKFSSKLFIRKRNLLKLLNLFTCEAHREVAIKTLIKESFRR